VVRPSRIEVSFIAMCGCRWACNNVPETGMKSVPPRG
jgi:hypothetical protein